MIELLIWHQEKYEYDFINIAWYQPSTVLRYTDSIVRILSISMHGPHGLVQKRKHCKKVHGYLGGKVIFYDADNVIQTRPDNIVISYMI